MLSSGGHVHFLRLEEPKAKLVRPTARDATSNALCCQRPHFGKTLSSTQCGLAPKA